MSIDGDLPLSSLEGLQAESQVAWIDARAPDFQLGGVTALKYAQARNAS